MLIPPIDSSIPAMPSTAAAGEGVGGAGAAYPQNVPAEVPPMQPAVPTAAELAQAVSKSNETVQAHVTNLEFAIDPDTKTVVVKLLDTATHEVIRQVPSPEMLRIAQSLDQMQGLLLRTKA